MAIVDAAELELIGGVPLPAAADLLALNPTNGKVYSGDVQSTRGCHSIIVDAKTHLVWIAYAKGDQSLLQPFIPTGRMLPRK